MAEGWILLHRKITKNPFWHERPFDKARAWVDMLLLANYSDSYFFVRGQEVSILRGQLAWSEVSLAERWGWSRNKVRRYLDVLKTKQQIEQHGSNLTSLITITKYEEYQVTGTVDDTANDTPNGTADGTANDTADGTHKKEGKKKGKKEDKTFCASGDALQGAERDFYLTAKKRKLTGERLSTFNEFMEAFGDRRGKAQAADSWHDIKPFPRSLFDEIIAGARRYNEGREQMLKENRTPKMAQGWLTGRRWEDEPPQSGKESGRPVTTTADIERFQKAQAKYDAA